MKAFLALLGFTVMCSLQLRAGPETIVRERAKELRDQNNVRQGVAPPTQSQPAAGANPAARPPQPSPALGKLQTDLGAISTTVTPEQKQKLAADIMLAAQGAKPSSATAAKLAGDMAAAMAEKPLPAASRARLAQELDAILNPSKYPQAKPDGIFKDVQAIFQESGLQRAKAVVIADDVKALSAEVQSGGGK
jgi:hypothetical protein